MEYGKGLISGIIAGLILGFGDWLILIFPETYRNETMWTVVFSVLVMGIFMGLIYSLINSSIPGKGMVKGVNYGILVWLLAGLKSIIIVITLLPIGIATINLIINILSYLIAGVAISVIHDRYTKQQ